jgi:tryptophan synthase alpha subunit
MAWRLQVSTREHFQTVGALGDGVVIGSAIIRTIQAAGMRTVGAWPRGARLGFTAAHEHAPRGV